MSNDTLNNYKLRPTALGNVTPEGWLRSQLIVQQNGLSGHIDALWEDLGEQSGWLGGAGENWERGPYYLDGLIPLAWSLGDTALQQKAQRWIEWMLQSQRTDGFFGPADNPDWWPRMVALKAVTQYHEATGDERVLPFLDRYFRFQLEHLPQQPLSMWAAARGQEQLLPMLYLYRQTGQAYLLELAHLLRGQSYRWDTFFRAFPYPQRTHAYLNRPLFMAAKRVTLISDWTAKRLRRIRAPKPPTKAQIDKSNASRFLRVFHETHSVNLAMALKMPALDTLFGGDPAGAEASQVGIDALTTYHGLANFVFSGDEHLNGRSPAVGAELCLVAEYLFSLETLLAVTGKAAYADLLEQVAFNAWPATFTGDMCAHQYVQQVNQVEASRKKRGWYDAYSEANLFGLKPNFGCCAANMHQGWPKLLGSLLMEHPSGILAAVYAPCSVTISVGGTTIRLTEETDYPFDENISLTFNEINNTAKSLEFSLFLRIPAWASTFELLLNGEPQSVLPKDGFVELRQFFHKGDQIQLRLPMALRIQKEAESGVTFHRGPLLLALPIDAERRMVRGSPPFADYELFPRSEWRFALVESELEHAKVVVSSPGEQPFGEESPPLTVRLRLARAPHWPMVRHSAGPVPPPFSAKEDALFEQTLVPYGCTLLRIAQFPAASILNNKE
ncbi:MAG: glycoside hydrolase family 127 protein [Christensenella sp.]|nr:glycoside hydrolase family 127 protein [Christensenella sp.]